MIRVKEILDFLNESEINYEVQGKESVQIRLFCPLNNLKDHCITWIRKGNRIPVDELNRLNEMVLFAEKGMSCTGNDFTIIYVENVHRTFFRVTEYFFGCLNPENITKKIEKSAIIETEDIGTGVYIGHHSFISKDVMIGNNVTIMHNVIIDCKAEIGDNTFIESGTVIGACGFGYLTDEAGKQEIVPHYGGVKIGKNVRIGANNTIIRGCLSDTVIEDDVKTADLVCISHNDIIKQGAMITCGTVIAGSTIVGENTWIAPGAVINNGIAIGEDAYIGIGSIVATKIRKKKKVFGNPARYID